MTSPTGHWYAPRHRSRNILRKENHDERVNSLHSAQFTGPASLADSRHDLVRTLAGRTATVVALILLAALAFPAPVQAVIGAVRVAAIQDTQQVVQVTITILQNEDVVAEEDTDKSGVAFIPLEEGRYTVVTEFTGRRIQEDITVEAEALASFTADFGRGVLQPNDAPLNRYNPVSVSTGDVPAAVEFGRVAAAPVNTLRQQTHRCQEISVCF